jgi:hypothetical protein
MRSRASNGAALADLFLIFHGARVGPENSHDEPAREVISSDPWSWNVGEHNFCAMTNPLVAMVVSLASSRGDRRAP